MERSIYQSLLGWKNKQERKPLILNGARQVGKTYILQEFGRREYRQLAFFSLDRDQKAAEVFEKGGSTADMLMALSAISQVDITPNDTLVVLDEVQDCPKALEALKYFARTRPIFISSWQDPCWAFLSTTASPILWARWRSCGSIR